MYVLRKLRSYVLYRQLPLKLIFCDTLSVDSQIDFKCENTNFHKQSKEPTKYQDLSIAPFRRSILNFNDLDCHVQFFFLYWIITWWQK